MRRNLERSKQYLERQGFTVGIVERRIQTDFHTILSDLFGFLDLVALGNKLTYGIQSCNDQDLQAHIRKLDSEEVLPYVHGWLEPPSNRFYLLSWAHRMVGRTPPRTKAHREAAARGITFARDGSWGRPIRRWTPRIFTFNKRLNLVEVTSGQLV